MKPTKLFVSVLVLLISLTGFSARADVLLESVKAGDAAGVREALLSGADVNQPDLSGSALHLAVGAGSVEVAEVLILAGADLEAVGEPSGAHPLHLAAQLNEATIAALLIEHGAEVDPVDSQGRTPLMVAAVNSNLETAEVLLSKGANPTARDTSYGAAPIHYAVWSNHVGIVKLLVSKGADINLVNSHNGETPLHHAAMGEADYSELIEFLLANGADSSIRDKNGKTPLQLARSPDIEELMRSLGVNE